MFLTNILKNLRNKNSLENSEPVTSQSPLDLFITDKIDDDKKFFVYGRPMFFIRLREFLIDPCDGPIECTPYIEARYVTDTGEIKSIELHENDLAHCRSCAEEYTGVN